MESRVAPHYVHCIGHGPLAMLCSLTVWYHKLFSIILDGAHQALKFASMFSSRDPSGDNSREKMLLHIDVLVAVGRLSDALSVVRKGSDSEHDLYSCFLDKCQKGM